MTNIAASVHHRLKNTSKESGRSFNDLAQYYALERWLYRLSKSRYADLFILKGALMLVAWRAPILRVTRDIDLLARTNNDPANIQSIVAEKAKRRAFVIRQGDVIRMKNEPGLVVAETLDASDWLTVKEHDQTGNGFWIGFHFSYSFSSVNSFPE